MFIHLAEEQLEQHLDKVKRLRAQADAAAAEEQEPPKFTDRVLAEMEVAREAARRYDAAAELLRLLENGAVVRRAFELADAIDLLA